MNPEQALIAQQDVATLYQAMHRLPARYERVLRLWYGIGCEPMIFKDIGEQLGVGRARAQQMARGAERRLRLPLMPKFRERLGAQRLRRALDAKTKEAARIRAFWAERQAEDDMRAEAERHNAIIDERIRLERVEAQKQSEQIRREILRRAEKIELELDKIPRQRKQRVVNPFGFSAERAAEYAAVLRGMVRT